MKKLLALVLALVMSMSLVTISNAAFKDADSIDNKEAVEVMNAVGVFIGDENGNFNAKSTLTREQAAKIIAYLDLGAKTAENLPSVKVFNDVEADRWSAKFIAYCAEAGYVNGVGNGNFDPAGQLTGLQFAKMLLCVLGYETAREGLVGTDWAIATAKLAAKNFLFADIDKSSTAVLTREEAAKITLNALESDTYEYPTDTTTVKGEGMEVVIGGSKATTIARNAGSKGDYKNRTGAGSTTPDDVQQLVEKLYDNDVKCVGDTDDFNRPCNKWTYKANKIGTYSQTPDYVLNDKVSLAKFYETVGSNVAKAIESNDGTKAAKLSIYVDGKKFVANAFGTSSAPNSVTDASPFIDKKSSKALAETGNGSVTEIFIDQDTNAATVIISNTYVLQANADYNSKTGEVSYTFVGTIPASLTTLVTAAPTPGSIPTGGEVLVTPTGKLSDEDFAIESVKEDDYLLATFANGSIQSVTPATIVTGKITTYEVDDSITIDGTKYEYGKLASDDNDNGYKANFKVGEQAKLVTDGTYVYYVDEARYGTDSFVYVGQVATPTGLTNGNLAADAYFVDGTNKAITIKNKYSDNITPIITQAQGDLDSWFKYTVKDDVYTLEKITPYAASPTTDTIGGDVDGKAAATYKLIENGKVTIGDSNGTGQVSIAKANSKTVFVVVDSKDNVKVYTGVKSAPTVTVTANTVTAKVVMDKTGYAKFVFVDTGSDATVKGGANNSDKVYLLKFKSETWINSEDKIYFYDALVNGEKTVVKTSDDYRVAGKGMFMLYSEVVYTGDGVIDSMDVVGTTDDDFVYGVGYDTIDHAKDVITLKDTSPSATNYYVLAKGAKLFLVTEKGSAMSEDKNAKYEVTEYTGNGLKSAFTGHAPYTYNYSGTLNSDGELTSLYVYVTSAT